jgi:hypothetical protein
VVNAPARRERPLSARAAAVANVDRADLVALVLALVELLDVRALSTDLVALGGPLVVRDLPGGAGLVDLADELAPDAVATLAEVLRATEAVR